MCTTKTNAQLIGDMAIKLAWAKSTKKKKWNYSYDDDKKWTCWEQLGYARPKKILMDMADACYSKHWDAGSKKYGYGGRVFACCDKFVGLVIRASGVNKKMPTTLEKFFTGEGFDKFKIIKTDGKKSKMKHGDIIVYRRNNGNGHTLIVVEINGKLFGAQAGLNHYFPVIKDLNNYDLSDFNKFTVYRAK